jgi:hypothetical protein
MARWSFQYRTWTPTAVADTANFTAPFMAMQGGSGTQRMNLWEVFMGGQAGASSPSIMVVARDSTVGATLTNNGTFVALDPATAALAAAPAPFSTSTTLPQRSSTLYLLNLSFNAFGGIVRWVYAPGEEVGMLGNTASNGELSLTAFTGGTPGLMGSHMIFEPF